MDLSEQQRIELTDAGVYFLRVIGDIYGSDRAMEIWSNLAHTVHPDLTAWAFSHMLSGQSNSRVVVTSLPMVPNKVGIIKVMRTYDCRSLGLKEALDIYHELESGKHIELKVFHEKVSACRDQLKALGCSGLTF